MTKQPEPPPDSTESPVVDAKPKAKDRTPEQKAAIKSLTRPREEITPKPESKPKPGFGKNILACKLRVGLVPDLLESSYSELAEICLNIEKEMPNIDFLDSDIEHMLEGEIPPESPCIHGTIQVESGDFRHLIADRIQKALNHGAIKNVQILNP